MLHLYGRQLELRARSQPMCPGHRIRVRVEVRVRVRVGVGVRVRVRVRVRVGN